MVQPTSLATSMPKVNVLLDQSDAVAFHIYGYHNGCVDTLQQDGFVYLYYKPYFASYYIK